jgi:shikimate dehydrogenase
MKVFCILSDKRAFQSKSPAIFSAVMKRVGLDGVYVPFMVEAMHLGEAVKSLRVLNIAGANVTVPYKEAVIPYLDVLSEGANMVGAINTIARDGDLLKGYNTNAVGFMDTLEALGFDPTDRTALVFGTGGASKAVVFILNWLRAAAIRVVGRSLEKARGMVGRLGGEPLAAENLAAGPHRAEIVVNATTVSAPHESPSFAAAIQNLSLQDCQLVLDLNYGRSQNIWRELAERHGARFEDGLSTLAHQAQRSFALWTGIRVEAAEFLKVLDIR